MVAEEVDIFYPNIHDATNWMTNALFKSYINPNTRQKVFRISEDSCVVNQHYLANGGYTRSYLFIGNHFLIISSSGGPITPKTYDMRSGIFEKASVYNFSLILNEYSILPMRFCKCELDSAGIEFEWSCSSDYLEWRLKS